MNRVELLDRIPRHARCRVKLNLDHRLVRAIGSRRSKDARYPRRRVGATRGLGREGRNEPPLPAATVILISGSRVHAVPRRQLLWDVEFRGRQRHRCRFKGNVFPATARFAVAWKASPCQAQRQLERILQTLRRLLRSGVNWARRMRRPRRGSRANDGDLHHSCGAVGTRVGSRTH